MERLRGIGVSPGIAIGEVSLTERVIFTSRKESISSFQVEGELERLRKAIKRTKDQLSRIKEETREKMGEDIMEQFCVFYFRYFRGNCFRME